MRLTVFRYLAASSVLFAVIAGQAASRPRYSGALRVEVGTAVASLDPAGLGSAGPANGTTDRWNNSGKSRTLAKLCVLVYDRLVQLDLTGAPQPALAISWAHDARAMCAGGSS